MGGLDTGIDLSLDQVSADLVSSDNILDKLTNSKPTTNESSKVSSICEIVNSPFPNQQNSYSESMQSDFRRPKCYTLSKPKELKDDMIRNVLPEQVLFYIFYNMPNERAQIVAAESLETKGWTYIQEEISWVRMKTLANGSSSFIRFDPHLWQE